MQHLAQLASELIRFRSIDIEEHQTELQKIAGFVEKRLKKLPGVFVKKFLISKKPALVVTFRKNQKTPAVFLNGHLDVVPAEKNQFSPFVKNGKLFGRGAHDMKGTCAVMIALIEHFARQKQKPDAGFMFVADEEFYGHASKTLCGKGYRPKLLIALEPTNENIVIETKGILWLKGVIPGKAAHGSMPWLGMNPLKTFYEGLRKFYRVFPPLQKEQWKTTCNIGEVSSGDCFNRVPPDLSFKMDIRYVPRDNPRNIIRKIKKCFPKNTQWTVVQSNAPHQKPKNMKTVAALRRIARSHELPAQLQRAPFCTDARFFSSAGVDCVVFGALGANMHGADEWVSVKSLEKIFRVMKDFLSV